MGFYTANFLAQGIACIFLFFRQRSKDDARDDANQLVVGNAGAEANSGFTRRYLAVYALTMGADWLQV